jgi:hypothetical protein
MILIFIIELLMAHPEGKSLVYQRFLIQNYFLFMIVFQLVNEFHVFH